MGNESQKWQNNFIDYPCWVEQIFPDELVNHEVDKKSYMNQVRDSIPTLQDLINSHCANHVLIEEHFNEAINAKWGECIGFLESFFIFSNQLSKYYDNTQIECQKYSDEYYNLLKILHFKSCYTFKETIMLICGGLPGGAFARIRALYESSIYLKFIQINGDACAKAFIGSAEIDRLIILKNIRKQEQNIDDDDEYFKFIDDHISSIKEELNNKKITDINGWALPFFNGKKRIVFKDFEKAVGLEKLRFIYDISSLNVHNDYSSISSSRALYNDGGVLGRSTNFLDSSMFMSLLLMNQLNIELMSSMNTNKSLFLSNISNYYAHIGFDLIIGKGIDNNPMQKKEQMNLLKLRAYILDLFG